AGSPPNPGRASRLSPPGKGKNPKEINMSRVVPRWSLFALAIVFAALLVSCGGHSGGSKGKPNNEDLAVTYFSHGGRTDVYRNDVLEVRFTAPIKWKSISDRTFRVLTGPNLLTPEAGALELDGNRILFHANRTNEGYHRDGRDDPGQSIPPDKPFGLESLSNYQIFIPGPPDLKTLQNKAGRPIVKSFFSSFQTSDLYIPELEPPEFIGIDGTGQLGFIPDLIFDDVIQEWVVAFDAQVVLQFSEVIDPATMDPGSTLLVRNEDVLDGLGRPIEVPGTLKPSRDGTRYFFVPSFHYGTGPYRISVTMTLGIQDLAGNPLANPRTLLFKTEFNPDVNTVAVISEKFEDNAFEDVPNTTAEWNTTREDWLVGGDITTTVVTPFDTGYVHNGTNAVRHGYGNNIPFTNNPAVGTTIPLVAKDITNFCSGWPNGVHAQSTYTMDDIGAPGAITEIAWGPATNALFAATHPNLQIRLGHTKDTAGVISSTFADNFKDGVPLPNFDGLYDLPQRADIDPQDPFGGYWPFPTLSTPFDFNGENGLLMDYAVDGAADCQQLRFWFFGVPGNPANPGVRQIVANTKTGASDTSTGGGQPLVYDMQLTKRRRLTIAQSLYYDSAREQPDYGQPILSPPQQAGGASFILEFQGADGMPDPVTGNIVADPSTETPWSSSIDVSDGKRFIRFRFTLIANLNSDTVAAFQTVQIPFQFKP
ncbi:MAG: Ig-like domain-containing domain, partial [Planctomycetota bacterium]